MVDSFGLVICVRSCMGSASACTTSHAGAELAHAHSPTPSRVAICDFKSAFVSRRRRAPTMFHRQRSARRLPNASAYSSPPLAVRKVYLKADDAGPRRQTIALVPNDLAQARRDATSNAEAWSHERRLRARAEEAFASERARRKLLEMQLQHLQRHVAPTCESTTAPRFGSDNDVKEAHAHVVDDEIPSTGANIAESDPYL